MNRLLRAVLALVAIVVAFAASVQAAEIPGKSITLPATERQVKVTYFRAPGDAKRPAVLLLHGAGGFDRRIADYNHYASVLANAGVDAYLFYYYNEQDDKMMSFGVDIFAQRYEAWAKQVDDVADYLLKQNDSNGKSGLSDFSTAASRRGAPQRSIPRSKQRPSFYARIPGPLTQSPRTIRRLPFF